MKSPTIKAWLLGFGFLVFVFVLWEVALRMEIFSQWLLFLLWSSPAEAAFIAAYLSPSKKIVIGSSMAIPAAVLAALLNWIPQTGGRDVDFPGLGGGLVLFTVVLVGATVLSTLGGMMGKWVTDESR